jgi:hypothetical protein
MWQTPASTLNESIWKAARAGDIGPSPEQVIDAHVDHRAHAIGG